MLLKIVISSEEKIIDLAFWLLISSINLKNHLFYLYEKQCNLGVQLNFFPSLVKSANFCCNDAICFCVFLFSCTVKKCPCFSAFSDLFSMLILLGYIESCEDKP